MFAVLHSDGVQAEQDAWACDYKLRANQSFELRVTLSTHIFATHHMHLQIHQKCVCKEPTKSPI